MANSVAAELAARRSTAMATANGAVLAPVGANMVIAKANGAVLVPVGANEVVAVMTGEQRRAGAVPIGTGRTGTATVKTTMGLKIVTQRGALIRGITTGRVKDVMRGAQM